MLILFLFLVRQRSVAVVRTEAVAVLHVCVILAVDALVLRAGVSEWFGIEGTRVLFSSTGLALALMMSGRGWSAKRGRPCEGNKIVRRWRTVMISKITTRSTKVWCWFGWLVGFGC